MEARLADEGDDEILVAVSSPEAAHAAGRAHDADARRARLRRLKVRDLLARRMLEAFICFQLDRTPAFKTRFERLKTEVDAVVVAKFLFHQEEDRTKALRLLKEIQKCLGLPKSERVTLREAIADALPQWRRGAIRRNEERRRRIAPCVREGLGLIAGLPPAEQASRLALFASDRDARELVRDGAIRADELARCSSRLLRGPGPTLLGCEVVEEVRYLVLRHAAEFPPSDDGKLEAA